MRTLLSFLGLVAGLSFCAVLPAAEISEVSVVGGYAPAIAVLPLEGLSGTTMTVSIGVGKGPSDGVLRYGLYQAGGNLAMGLAKGEKVCAEGRPLTIEIALPEAKAVCRYLLRLSLVRGGQPVASRDVTLFAYPSGLPERMRALVEKWSQQTGEGLAVFGPGKTIRPLLASWKISCEEADSFGSRRRAAIGDFIGAPLDFETLPGGPAESVLYLTSSPQPGHAGDYSKALASSGRGKTLCLASGDLAALSRSLALQYTLSTLLSQLLALPSSTPTP